MAWTAPRTWTDGELVNASIMNSHVRDNLLAAGEHLIVRKTSDESDSSSTFQNDDALTMTIAANEVWQFKAVILVVSLAAVDFTSRWTFPTGGNITGFWWTAPAATIFGNDFSSTSSPTGAANIPTEDTVMNTVLAEGVLVNGGTAGSLTLQWTNLAAGTATVKANSTLWAVKLA